MTAVTLAPAPSPATGRRSCPFQGLLPYSPEDWEWFFGRDRDARLISENLLAYELTIVYGPSGVGKSSVLSAGVMAELRRQAQRERQLGRVPFVSVIHGQWQTDPLGSLVTSISCAIRDQAAVLVPPMPAGTPLDERLSAWSHSLGAKLYVVLDQFEEYFLYHPRADDPVTVELGEAIAVLEDGTNFLISIREDALARLDRFEGIVPGLFDITYRIEPLDRAAARLAITGPRDRYNEAHPDDPVTIEEELIEEVLDKVRVGVAGPVDAAAIDDGHEDAVEAAQLQLVFERLWKSEIGAGRRALRLSTLDDMGGAEDVIRSHLVESMARLAKRDQRVAASVFSRLVTPSGAKVALSVDDLATYADVTPPEMLTLLERLAAGDLRLLRPVAPAPEQPDVPRFEIYHDVLGQPIRDWTGGRELEQARGEAHKERRRRIAATGLSVLLVALMAVAGALWLRSERQQQAEEAAVLAAQARNQIPQDPAEAVELALRAVDKAKSPTAVQALRESMAELDLEAVLSGHTAGVNAVAVSLDDRLVLTAGADGKARLWDSQDGTLLHALTGHVGPVLAASFTDNGTTAITAGEDGTIRLWDAATGEAAGTIHTDLGQVWGFSSAPGGTSLAAWGPSPAVEVWDLDSQIRIAALGHEGAESAGPAVFGQRAGRTFVATGDSEGVVRVWDTDGWREQARWSDLWWINSLDVAHDGAWVVIGGGRTNAFVWNWEDQPEGTGIDELPELSFPHENSDGVTEVSVSPDGEHIVTFGDRTAALWSVDTLAHTFEDRALAFDPLVLRGHTGFLTSAAWSADGTRVAIADQDGQIRVWDSWTGSFLDRLAGHRGAIWALAFTGDGRLVSTGEDRTARIWHGFEDGVFRGHDSWVNAVAIDDEHDLVVSAGADGRVIGHRRGDATTPLWTLDEGADGYDLGFLTAVAISPSARYVAAGGRYREVHIWDVGGAEPVIVDVWKAPAWITDLAFDPHHDRLAVGVGGGAVHLWSWTNPDEPISSLIGHRLWAKVAFSHHEGRIVTGGGDGTVRIWDARTGEQLAQPATHDGGVFGVAFTGDDGEVVSGGGDRRVLITDLASGQQRELLAHAHPITSLAVDTTGARIVSGDAGGYVAVWKASTGELLTLLHKHELYVNQIQLAADGTIYSAGDDDVVRGYACATCAEPGELITMARDRLRWLREPAPIVAVPTFGSEIAVGTCTVDPGGEFSKAQPVDCSEPHALEFFAAFELPDEPGTSYPGDSELQERADELCTSRAAGLASEVPPGLIVSSYQSTDEAWEGGSRHVQCVFQSEGGGEWAGSALAGTARVP